VVGQGAKSDVEFATTLTTKPEAPTDLVISGVGSTSAQLKWTAPVDRGGLAITDFVIDISSDGGVSWTRVADGVSSALSVGLAGLSGLTDYQVRVAAVNADGRSPFSSEATFTTIGEVSSVPLNLDAMSIGTQSVTLTWDRPNVLNGLPITDYVIERSLDGGTSWLEVPHDVPALSKTFVVSGLGKGRAYLFRVKAVNAAGISKASAPLSLTTGTTLPAAPTGLVLVDGWPTTDTVKVTWAAPVDRGGLAIRDYRIEYSRNGGKTWILVKHAPSPKRLLTLQGLVSGKTYKLRVKSVTAKGVSKTAVVIQFQTN
jgi:hypothetical protein